MRIKLAILLLMISFFKITSAQSESESETDINLQGQVPRIEFESSKYNFGNVYRGSIVTHSFPFENTGNGILVLSSLHAACGCLNTKVYAADGKTLQSIFKPNEKGIIRIDFDSSQFVGNVVRSVTAETNMGTASPTVTLTLTAYVLEEISSNPPLVYVGKVDKNTQRIFTINLSLLNRINGNQSNNIVDKLDNLKEKIGTSLLAKPFEDKILDNAAPLKILAVESSVPYIEATLLPFTSGKPQQIQIKFNNSSPIGPFHAKIIAWNNSTYYKDYEIPVVGDVVGQVQSSAKYVEFGVVSGEKSSERVITYSSNQKNFAITSVKIDLKKLQEMKNFKNSDIFVIKKEKTSLKPSFDPDSAVAYSVHFKLAYPRGLDRSQDLEDSSGINVSGNFLVMTNDPDYKEISVPFFGVLRKEP